MADGETETEGRKLLAQNLQPHGEYSQRRLADLLGIRQSSVSLWLSGKARPEAQHRLALRLLFGIPQRKWLTGDETARLDVVRKAAPSRPRRPRGKRARAAA